MGSVILSHCFISHQLQISAYVRKKDSFHIHHSNSPGLDTISFTSPMGLNDYLPWDIHNLLIGASYSTPQCRVKYAAHHGVVITCLGVPRNVHILHCLFSCLLNIWEAITVCLKEPHRKSSKLWWWHHDKQCLTHHAKRLSMTTLKT